MDLKSLHCKDLGGWVVLDNYELLSLRVKILRPPPPSIVKIENFHPVLTPSLNPLENIGRSLIKYASIPYIQYMYTVILSYKYENFHLVLWFMDSLQ